MRVYKIMSTDYSHFKWQILRGHHVVENILDINRKPLPVTLHPSIERGRLAVVILYVMDDHAEQLGTAISQNNVSYDGVVHEDVDVTVRDAVDSYHDALHEPLLYVFAAQDPELASEVVSRRLVALREAKEETRRKLEESFGEMITDPFSVSDITHMRRIRELLVNDPTGFALVDFGYEALKRAYLALTRLRELPTPLPPRLYGGERAVENYKALYELVRKRAGRSIVN